MPNEDRKYIVKNFDTEVFSFEFVKGEFTDSFRVLDIFDESLLPEYFRANGLTDDNLERWLSMRKLPSNRTFADEFLAKFGLDSKDIAGILELSKGLSLNDCFWIVSDSSAIARCGVYMISTEEITILETCLASRPYANIYNKRRGAGSRRELQFIPKGC